MTTTMTNIGILFVLPAGMPTAPLRTKGSIRLKVAALVETHHHHHHDHGDAHRHHAGHDHQQHANDHGDHGHQMIITTTIIMLPMLLLVRHIASNRQLQSCA